MRFVRAMAASYAFLNDPENRAEVVKIIAENGKISEQAADAVFAPYLEADKNVLPKRGEISLAAFDRVLGLMAQAGVVPTPAPDAARFVDLQYLRAAGIGE